MQFMIEVKNGLNANKRNGSHETMTNKLHQSANNQVAAESCKKRSNRLYVIQNEKSWVLIANRTSEQYLL